MGQMEGERSLGEMWHAMPSYIVVTAAMAVSAARYTDVLVNVTLL